MSAGTALEMWSKQNVSVESPDGLRRTVRIQTAFTVTISASDRAEMAYTASGLPLVGDLYPGTSFVYCKSLAVQRVSPIFAIVSANFEGEIGPGSDTSGSPLDNEVRISWSTSTTDEAIDEDWNGKPIVTKNNEPIEGLTERLTDDVVTIERNYLAINRYALRAYRRATNSDTFLGWPPGTARIINDTASATFVNGRAAFWVVSATIQFREPFRTTADKAWYKRVRHEGFYVRDSASDDPHLARDSQKMPVTKPVLLKEDGTLEEDSEKAFWLEFQTLGSLPFNALGLVS